MSAALASIIDRSRRDREEWRYTDVEKVLAANAVRGDGVPTALTVSRDPSITPSPLVAGAPLPSLMADAAPCQRMVFVGGVWSQEQSTFGDLPTTILQQDATGGYRLTLAAQSCLVTAPIELVFVGAGEKSVRLAVEVGANASLTIIEHHINDSDMAQVIEMDIRLDPQAKLVHDKIAHGMRGAGHFARTTVRVESGAYYRNFALIKDTRLMRNEMDVTLAGALAQCGLYGAMLLQNHEHADVWTRVTHAAPHGISRQLYKAVVKDQARGVFQGKIKVAAGAQKTDGQQLCRALLLSDQAEMDAKPQLEIDADDVACSHGCAIGDLDSDAMFYLRTRGLSESEARNLLLRAFVDEVIDTIQADDARGYVRDLAGGWMG